MRWRSGGKLRRCWIRLRPARDTSGRTCFQWVAALHSGNFKCFRGCWQGAGATRMLQRPLRISGGASRSAAGRCWPWAVTGATSAGPRATCMLHQGPAEPGCERPARAPWQGPSPLPFRNSDPWPAGGQSPRPAPAPPPAGASRPPGRALACRWCGWHGSLWQRSERAGETRYVSCSRPEGGGTAPLPWQGPSPLPQRPADPWPAGGPKPPASARPALGGRFSPAGSGAGLCWRGWHGSWCQRSARAGETHAFPFPARRGRGRSESEPPAPLQWQGPSPLPQRHADPWPAGGPKPPASARPALGGRFSPAGSGVGLCWCGWHGSWWHCRGRAGETQCVS
jgi:hypothetical protein